MLDLILLPYDTKTGKTQQEAIQQAAKAETYGLTMAVATDNTCLDDDFCELVKDGVQVIITDYGFLGPLYKRAKGLDSLENTAVLVMFGSPSRAVLLSATEQQETGLICIGAINLYEQNNSYAYMSLMRALKTAERDENGHIPAETLAMKLAEFESTNCYAACVGRDLLHKYPASCAGWLGCYGI